MGETERNVEVPEADESELKKEVAQAEFRLQELSKSNE